MKSTGVKVFWLQGQRMWVLSEKVLSRLISQENEQKVNVRKKGCESCLKPIWKKTGLCQWEVWKTMFGEMLMWKRLWIKEHAFKKMLQEWGWKNMVYNVCREKITFP